VTTLVDMPLNSIPATTSVEGLDAKLRAADGVCRVDVGFWGGVIPGNGACLEPLARRGVLGFKCFLAPSGVEEFPHVSEADLRAAAPTLARLRLPLLVHAELPEHLREPRPGANPRDHRTWLESRPPESEHAAIGMLIELSRATGARVHVVHLATAGAVPALAAARAAGVALTVETCPHYLTFAAEEIPDGGTQYKCAPPIRQREHRDGLWRALEAGHIDLVATDHSPAPPAMKHLHDGDFLLAWGGIASLQLGLLATWTEASARGNSLEQLARWMCRAPAMLAGLHDRKGAIAVGLDADFVIWDPDATTLVDATVLEHRHPVTPYAGRQLRGRVVRTLLRGKVVFDDGVHPDAAFGQLILRRDPDAKIAAS
jgi:allantoinase